MIIGQCLSMSRKLSHVTQEKFHIITSETKIKSYPLLFNRIALFKLLIHNGKLNS